MAKFKVVALFKQGHHSKNDNFEYEMETLDPIGAKILAISGGDETEMLNATRNADAIIASGPMVSRTLIENLEQCKIISSGSVGTDTIDVAAAIEKGIPVTNVPDTFIDEVADHTMTLILATYRRLVMMDKMTRENRWKESRAYLETFPRLRGQTLGFIAFGHVAQAVAKRAAAFGVNMLAYDPYIDELVISEHAVEPVSLDELLQLSDIVSMHVPGMPETNRLLTDKHFRLMKPTSLFINNGRGSTVDENSLIRALEEGWISGAGLDVLEKEPPDPENPLLQMENVILTAHVASASARFHPSRRRRVGLEISLALRGRWPMSCVNPSVLEKSTLTRWQPYPMGRGPAR